MRYDVAMQIAIAGGWKKTNNDVEQAVRKTVRDIMARGDSIVCGGALGVDFFAVDEALLCDGGISRTTVLIPSDLAYYILDLEKHINEGLASEQAVALLIAQLELLKAEGALIEGFETDLSQSSYFARIKDIVAESEALIAFHINGSAGTQATIDAAHEKGIPVEVFSYKI